MELTNFLLQNIVLFKKHGFKKEDHIRQCYVLKQEVTGL